MKRVEFSRRHFIKSVSDNLSASMAVCYLGRVPPVGSSLTVTIIDYTTKYLFLLVHSFLSSLKPLHILLFYYVSPEPLNENYTLTPC